MAEKYTDAVHNSIKATLEYHEQRGTQAIGLNTSLVRAMIDEIERLRGKYIIWQKLSPIPLSQNPESEPE